MTDTDLRKLNRADLMELLVSQGKENESLKQQLQTAKALLDERRIALEETGNIAEASLRLNGVFQAAQDAAEQYLVSIRARSEEQESRCAAIEAEAKAEAARILQETQAYCGALRSEAEAEAAKLREETSRICAEQTAEAEVKSKVYWDEVSQRLEEFYNAHCGLRELLRVDFRKGSSAE